MGELPDLPQKEFAKLLGARALFEDFITLIVTKNAKFPGKINNHS
jgi:hypothetical protein